MLRTVTSHLSLDVRSPLEIELLVAVADGAYDRSELLTVRHEDGPLDVTEIKLEDARPEILRRMRQRPPLIAISAHTGRGLERLLALIEAVFVPYAGRITTAQLNRALQELREARQPPGRRGRRLNLLYGTQVSSRPPRFRFFVNDRSLVTRDYGYWVENELRARFGLEGVPVSIDFVTSE